MSLINNSKMIKQVIDFTGVQNGKMHPSDIDAVLEFDNKLLILMEIKYKSSPIQTGQRLLLERICDAWHKKDKKNTGKKRKAIVLKVEHFEEDLETNIPLEKCYVTEFYYAKTWKRLEKPRNFVSYLNQIGRITGIEKCKF